MVYYFNLCRDGQTRAVLAATTVCRITQKTEKEKDAGVFPGKRRFRAGFRDGGCLFVLFILIQMRLKGAFFWLKN
ncbi:MAG: hypothetical protein ACI3V0_08810 [Faecousia sp.]